MPTNTTNLNLKKPIVGADEDLWGGYINDNLDDLDSLLGGASPLALDAVNTRVGIGTSSPATHLDVTGATSSLQARFGGTADRGLEVSTATTFSTPDAVAILNAKDSTYGTMIFQTKSTERMRITSSGNVGIGTSSPNSIGTGVPTIDLKGNDASQPDRSGGLYFTRYDGTGSMFIAHTDGANVISGLSTYPTVFKTNSAERMRIDSSGSLLVGTTVSGGAGGMSVRVGGFTPNLLFNRNSTTATSYPLEFQNGGSIVGFVSYNNTGTSYNTSSDYRLKEDIQPMVGASDRVLALKPCNFAWKIDGTRVDGFLAHEAQEVVPEAVRGTKDAMTTEEYEVTPAVYEDVVIPAVLDDDGNEIEPERTEQRLVSEAVMGTREVPDYQGIDQSKLVPLLTAALQEALTEIADLKTRVAALETA